MAKKTQNQVYCQIRREWVAAVPEELVRQNLIREMVGRLNYPSSNLLLERKLQEVPHVAQQGLTLVPLRRADIICFGKDIHPNYPLYPLLLVECKAVNLSAKVISQVAGYNHYLQAYYICIANQDEVQTGWYDVEIREYKFVNGLPAYEELIKGFKQHIQGSAN